MTTEYSPGLRLRVELGSGQARFLDELRGSIRHPSRTWHRSAPLRAFGVSPGTAHRYLTRLRELGVIAVQSVLGCEGFVRFTLAVNFWRTRPWRRVAPSRIAPAPGQLLAFERDEPPDELADPPEWSREAERILSPLPLHPDEELADPDELSDEQLAAELDRVLDWLPEAPEPARERLRPLTFDEKMERAGANPDLLAKNRHVRS